MKNLWRKIRCRLLGHEWEYEAVVRRGFQERVCRRCFADGKVAARGNHLDHWRA